ncbi:hypothetical protein V3M90_08585, partial [Trueperella pyogenes]|uniref:hypothetical protein n=1 Tax=Trueperella pyogenes TaxID=1661 RepID=UPI00345D8898
MTRRLEKKFVQSSPRRLERLPPAGRLAWMAARHFLAGGGTRLIGQNVLLGLVGFVPGSTVVEVGPV